MIDISVIQAKKQEYETQLNGVQQGLKQLEQQYLQQKEQGTALMHQLAGAIAAYQGLLEVPQGLLEVPDPSDPSPVDVPAAATLLESDTPSATPAGN